MKKLLSALILVVVSSSAMAVNWAYVAGNDTIFAYVAVGSTSLYRY